MSNQDCLKETIIISVPIIAAIGFVFIAIYYINAGSNKTDICRELIKQTSSAPSSCFK